MKRLSDLFGDYSLPNVMGRLGHRIGGWFGHGDTGGVMPPSYPISQVPGLTQQPFTTYNDYNTGGFTNPNVGGDPYTPPVGDNPFVNSQGGGGASQQYDPFANFTGGFTGNSSGGTLGDGYVVDPSQWGQFGLGGDSGEQDSTGRKSQFATHMNEGGNGAHLSLFMQRRYGINPHTGGADPAYSAGMGTGGNAPVQPMGMGMGGNLPAQQGGMSMGGNQQAHPFGIPPEPVFGNKQPPGGLIR